MATSKTLPRGIRNNNPLNIRIGNVWQGEVDHPTDRSFEQFKQMEYGIRAAFVILRRYIRHYGINTIAEIIERWAPRSENDTNAYVRKVVQLANIPGDVPIKYEDKDKMYALVDAMIQVECGQSVPMSKIQKGYELA